MKCRGRINVYMTSLVCLKQNGFPLKKEKLAIELPNFISEQVYMGARKVNDSLGFLWKGFCFGCRKVTHLPICEYKIGCFMKNVVWP